MFNHLSILASLCVAAALPLSAVSAQATVDLEGNVKVVRTLEADGATSTTLEEPTTVVPGDRLRFATLYRNAADELVEDFVITNPLPGAVMLAEPGTFSVSVDGETFAALAELTMTAEDGTTRPAELGDVTHIRWTLARLEPGASGSVEYYGVVR